MEMDLISRTTKLAYSDDMCCLKSRALFISHFQVFHYGYFVGSSGGECDPKLEKGLEVCLNVDEQRHILNSRPFVEYKGTVPQIELQSKQKELELEANVLIAKGAKVLVAVLAYDEASELCGGRLPGYISKCSTLRVVKLGNNPGCPCGGTHVADISDIGSLKVTQIRMKKGFTKVFYIVGSTVDIQFERKKRKPRPDVVLYTVNY